MPNLGKHIPLEAYVDPTVKRWWEYHGPSGQSYLYMIIPPGPLEAIKQRMPSTCGSSNPQHSIAFLEPLTSLSSHLHNQEISDPPQHTERLKMGEVGNDKRNSEVKYQKSYFDVLGLCCSSEVPLIEKILKPLDGIQKVSVIVPSKTVIVVHDSLLISPLQIVKALNQARLEATIRAYGTDNIIKKWPSPYILACGVLLLISLFKRFFHPLRWFALAAVVVGMPPIIFRSIAAVRRCTLDINILMFIAVGGAVALGDYSEAGFIVFLFTVAEWLEARASRKATAGMSLLMNMAPQKAVLAETGQVVDARDVKINTVLAVKAGEVIPIDGVVVDGRSEVDERSLTGESFPVAKQAQSLVWAGTLNIDGYVSVRTSALAEHSAVAKMARLVEEAQNSRSKTQRLIDSCAKYYTPAVVIATVGFAVIPLIMRVHNPKHWFQLALVLLVSACPCALVLSTPVATFCALLKAARTGLLIKGGDVLEALARIKVVAFDKTGTITRGEFTVVEFRSIDNEITLHELLYWVASIESKSSHPMASALVDCARLNSIEPKPDCVREFHIYPGEGICGEIDGKTIYIGNKRIAARASCETVPELEDLKEGVTVGHVFSGTVPVGVFTLSDTCRTGSAEAIKELKLLGIKTAMLTGDSTAAAKHAQNQLGHAIEDLHAELLPEDKVRIINDLKTREGSIAMVGDGMNDAPALAMANVGISMGISGSAIAMETSHITLMSNDIRKIPRAIRLARKTHFKIIGNIFFSIITKIAILALAFAGHPLLWAAVLADVGTCLLVILNSMMLLRTRNQKEKKCCGSSHKPHVQRPICVDHCAKGACKSASTCGLLNSSSCLDEHSCHDHHDAEELRMHNNCKKEDCHKEPPSHCCQESVRHTRNASQEHLISITPALEHQDDHSQKKHCRRHAACNHKPSIREDCRSHVTCGDRPLDNNSSRASANICSNTNKNGTGKCCKSDWEECKRNDGHSSSQEIMREIGGCCRSYMKECGKTDSCCGGSMIPEIITE